MIRKIVAFLIHLGISLSLFLIFLYFSKFIWYPEFYFEVSGVWNAILTVAFVDVGLGPILTLVLYKQGKPGLKFDLTMVASLQILALVWGTWVLYSERPILTVYYQDNFYCLSESQIINANADLNKLAKADKMLVAQAFLPLPKNAEETERRKTFLKQKTSDGIDLPAFVFGTQFEPINQENLAKIIHDELDIARAIKRSPKYQEIWQAFRNKHQESVRHYSYFPLACGTTEHLAVLDQKTGAIVDAIPINFLDATKKRFLNSEKQQEDMKFLFQ